MANPFRGMGGGLNMKALENMQKQMLEQAEKMQERLDAARIETSAGGGMVKAVMSGSGNLMEIVISPDVVDPDDVEMLQDLVVTAVREALDKAREMQAQEQQKLIPGNLPGLGGLGF
jgi:DNA-binding YbaB/EbfC family protein